MNWNEYFFSICAAVAKKSHCKSRQIGAVIAHNNAIISTGYNGPPRGMNHCKTDNGTCPRRFINGYSSGKYLDKCPAGHAESNAIAQAAMNGVSTKGATLYLNFTLPCKDCMTKIINSGITTIHCSKIGYYDKLSIKMIEQCDITIFQGGIEYEKNRADRNLPCSEG